MLSIKDASMVIMLGIVAGNISAQQKSPVKPLLFHSINNVGLLEGQAGSALQLLSINGTGFLSLPNHPTIFRFEKRIWTG
jgi:hypothetical protein